MFYNARGKVIKLFDDYTTIVSKAKYEVKHGKDLKILTPKQMLQRLPIALTQAKAVVMTIRKNIKKSYNNNKFKISAPTWNGEFELPDGSYSVSDIQDYFEYILKKHGEKTIKPSIRLY